MNRTVATSRLPLVAMAPWLVLPLFLVDAIGRDFSVSHWTMLVAIAALLSIAGGWWESRRGRAARLDPPALALVAALAGWLLLTWGLNVISFSGFNVHYTSQDCSYFNQVLWNTVSSGGRRLLEGGLYQETMYSPPVHSHFAVHVSPFLLLLTPFYALVPNIATLFFLRNIVIGVGCWLLYRELKGPLGIRAAALAVAAYLLHPNTILATTAEVSETAFALPAVIWAVGAAQRLRMREWAAAAIVLALVREDAVFPAAASALVAAVRSRKPAWVALGVLAAGWFVFCEKVVLPAFGPAGGKVVATVYKDVGGSSVGILGTLLTRPQTLLALLADPVRLSYLGQLARSFAGLFLLSPAALAAGPTLLAIMLIPTALYPSVFVPWQIYSAPIVATLALSSGLGAARWSTRGAKGPARERAGVTLALALVAASLFSQVQGIGFGWLLRARPAPLAHAYRQLLREIPPGAPVAAVSQMIPALSQREHVYALRFRGRPGDRDEAAIFENAAYVVADLDSMRARWEHAAGPGYPRFLARLQADPAWVEIDRVDQLALYRNRERAGK